MRQQGQVLRLKASGPDGRPLWAYRYRDGGRASRRVHWGGFASEQDAREALQRALETLRRAQRAAGSPTLAELVEEYIAQHDVEPAAIEKLRWLLGKAVAAFGDLRVGELRPQEIAAWRLTIPPGHRFEATQALRQVLERAVVWGMIDVNPAKQGVDNPQRRRTETRPFESWGELGAVAARLGARYGAMVIFAAATGLRPSAWIALERRDIDRDQRVVHVRRAFTGGGLRSTKTEGSVRAVPLQAIALAALDQSPSGPRPRFCSPRPRAATSTFTTSAPATGSPPSSQPESGRCAGSTISATPSPPSPSGPASPPSTSPAMFPRPPSSPELLSPDDCLRTGRAPAGTPDLKLRPV